MAGNGKGGTGTAGQYLPSKRKRDGDRESMFPKHFPFSSSGVDDHISGGINSINSSDHQFRKDYVRPDLEAKAAPKAPSFPRFTKTEETYEEPEDLDKYIEEHYKPFGSKYSGVSAGTWARVKRGKYMGDLAQVVNVNEFQRKATVKLLPRLDLQAMTKKYSEGICNQYTSPAPRLITSKELEAYRSRIRHSLDPDTGDLYEVFDGMKLKDGFVFKKLALDSLNFSNCNPSEAELAIFNPPKNQESNDLNKQQTNNNKSCASGIGVGFEGLSEASFVEKLRSGAQEWSGLIEEVAARWLGKESVEEQLRVALLELQSRKERVSAVEAERDSFRDRLNHEKKRIYGMFRRIMDTDFEVFMRLKEDVGIWCARHEANV